jgi:hypothetical protein
VEINRLVVGESEMCAMINISAQTCWRRHRAIKLTGNRNLLPPFKLVGSRRKYPIMGINLWLQS